MKKLICLLTTMIMLLSLFSFSPSAEAEARWVLVDVIDHEYSGEWASANKSESYNYSPSYSRGSYSSITRYIGESDDYYDPPYVHGEALGVQAIWGTPPASFGADEKVSLNISISTTENSLSAFKFSGSTRAFWGSSNITNADGKYFYEVYWSSDPAKHYKSMSDTVSFTPGRGSEGQKASLWLTYYNSYKLETEYVYEWSSTKTPIEYSTVALKPTPGPKPYAKNTETDSNYVDSGIKVSDLYGEVLIRRGDNEDSWELLEIGSVIYEGDHIKTEYNSGVRLSMLDMTTFDIKAESEIIITVPEGNDSKLKLVIGNIYTNVKKMLDGGIMEVEMTQVMAGARGTTFTLSETGSTSTVKVLEGIVDVRALNTGNSVEVKAGSMAAVTKGGNPVVKGISIAEEAEKWGKTIIELQLNNKYMKINGVQYEIDKGRGTVPATVNNRTLIPIRSVVEALGGTIGYDVAESKITINLNNKVLEMWINKTDIRLDGKNMKMDVAPISINGRTMVPVRFVAENFGYEVQWKQTEKKIIIQ